MTNASSDHPAGLEPLPGELGIPDVSAPSRPPMSRKGLLAVGLLVCGLVGVLAFSIHRFAASGRHGDEDAARQARERPTAATTTPHKLDMPAQEASAVAVPTSPRIPALRPLPEENADPIGVRRTGEGSPKTSRSHPQQPEDAPVLIVSSRMGAQAPMPSTSAQRLGIGSADNTALPASVDANDALSATTRNLQAYQRQLQGVLERLTQTAKSGQPGLPAAAPAIGPLLSGSINRGAGSTGADPAVGASERSGTPFVAAGMLGNRSLTLAKGTAFTCALKTRVISAASGLLGCQVQRNVYSNDGRVLLIERGSHLDGEYHITSLRPGSVRIPVLWTRILTPLGVTVDIGSPGTGQLGEAGIDGYVDNRWSERIGAAMLLSLIDDSVKLVVQDQANRQDDGDGRSTVVLPSTTANGSKLAEKVLDSTINIPPLLYRNQGGMVGIYVARDVDFSTVYELRPSARGDAP
jgi:type IV secretion system protein VirB10